MTDTAEIYDISRPLSPELGYWPGDTPYQFGFSATIADGSAVNVGAMSMSTHFGTHVDAPYHFDDEGATLDRLPLSVFIGPAVVVDFSGVEIIRVEQFREWLQPSCPRVLIKTCRWPKSGRFPESIPLLDPAVPDFLASRGVALFGTDLPSVDALDSKDLNIHKALLRNGIHILESLYLEDVAAGSYDLFAAPLSIVGADAAPCRALLKTG